jgi:hypothetical protein
MSWLAIGVSALRRKKAGQSTAPHPAGKKKRQAERPWRFFVCSVSFYREEQEEYGRGGWIRTNAWQDQNLLPYRLATPL